MQRSNEDPDATAARPASRGRSQVSDIILAGLAADLAPSINQSVIFCKSEAFMTAVCRKHGRATSNMYGLADLPAMPQEMIRQHAGHHGLADRHRPNADAGVMAALGHDVDIGALAVHGRAATDRRVGFTTKALTTTGWRSKCRLKRRQR